MTIGCDHHGDLDMLVAQPGDTTGPFSFNGGTSFQLQAKLGEKSNRLIEGFHHDTDIVHTYEFVVCQSFKFYYLLFQIFWRNMLCQPYSIVEMKSFFSYSPDL